MTAARFSTAFSLRYLRAVATTLYFFEGDRFTDDPDDRGGATQYGLTERFLLAHIGPAAIHPRELTCEDALAIYWTYLWVPQRLESVPGEIAGKVFDMMLPMGEPQAAKYFQRALNDALAGTPRPPLVVDGAIGAKTIAAAEAAAGRAKVVMDRLIGLSHQHYEGIVRRDPSQAKWLGGWRRRADYDPSRLRA